MSTDAHCENCIWFTPHKGGRFFNRNPDTGVCRVGPRMPAGAGFLAVMYDWEFPIMYKDDLCGCYDDGKEDE